MLRFSYIACLALCLFGACSHNIGDACNTNVDCALDGTRFCDTAPPNGYCTVQGCDVDTCPTEAVCIRFYTPIANEACNYNDCVAQGGSPDGGTGACQPSERCECDYTNDSTAGAMCADTGAAGFACQSGTAHCASENSEQRWCMYKCKSNSDCRKHYECRETGTLGAEPVPDLDHPYGKPAKFCVSSGNQDDSNDEIPTNPTTGDTVR